MHHSTAHVLRFEQHSRSAKATGPGQKEGPVYHWGTCNRSADALAPPCGVPEPGSAGAIAELGCGIGTWRCARCRRATHIRSKRQLTHLSSAAESRVRRGLGRFGRTCLRCASTGWRILTRSGVGTFWRNAQVLRVRRFDPSQAAARNRRTCSKASGHGAKGCRGSRGRRRKLRRRKLRRRCVRRRDVHESLHRHQRGSRQPRALNSRSGFGRV